ncbi:hypothetical protein PM082_022992 [Marasmius tenuissimus]|nr:hypothetical protein PM082_022992 [Marasmius tenuissimus]
MLKNPDSDGQVAVFGVLDRKKKPAKIILVNSTSKCDYMLLAVFRTSSPSTANPSSFTSTPSLHAFSKGLPMTIPPSADTSVRPSFCCSQYDLEKLMAKMANVAEYMLHSTKDKNENVALEARELRLTFAEDAVLGPYLQPLLGKGAPVFTGSSPGYPSRPWCICCADSGMGYETRCRGPDHLRNTVPLDTWDTAPVLSGLLKVWNGTTSWHEVHVQTAAVE